MHLGQDAEVGHHENAVLGQTGDPLRKEGVNQHHGGLLLAGRVREHAARSHQQVQVHHLDQRFDPGILIEGVGDGALLLHPLESGGKGPVLEKGQAKRLSGDRLFEDQLLGRLGDGGRPDHLVLDPVAQVPLFHGKGHPPHDVGQSGFGQDVGDGIAHPQIGRYRAVEVLPEHAEDIGGGPPDIDPHGIDPGFIGHPLEDGAHRCRRGQDIGVDPFHQPGVAGRLLHDVLQKQVMDPFTGGQEDFFLQRGAQVVDDAEIGLSTQHPGDLIASGPVAGIDDRQAITGPQSRLGIGGRNGFGDLDHLVGAGAVNLAGDQNHVRTELPDAFDALVGQPAVVEGDDVHHDRAGAQGGPFGAFGRHRPDHSGHHHLQSSPGAGGGNIEIAPLLATGGAYDPALGVQQLAARELTQLGHRVEHAQSHVLEGGFHGGGSFASMGLAVLLPNLLDEDGLGGGAAAVGGENDSDIVQRGQRAAPSRSLPGEEDRGFPAACSSISCSRHSTLWLRSRMRRTRPYSVAANSPRTTGSKKAMA